MDTTLLDAFKEEQCVLDLGREGLRVGDVRCLITDRSEDLLLIREVADDLTADGFRVLRIEDITFIRWSTEVLSQWSRALAGNPERPSECPRVELVNWTSTILSALRTEPLITIHREELDGSTCYVGKDIEIKGAILVAKSIAPEAKEDGYFAIRIDDITRIDFRGTYERTLAKLMV